LPCPTCNIPEEGSAPRPPEGLEAEVSADELTADECDEFAEAFLHDAAASSGLVRENWLKLAERFRTLSVMKRASRKVN
jgi:hypothetical protein